jgi:hypothetical protein
MPLLIEKLEERTKVIRKKKACEGFWKTGLSFACHQIRLDEDFGKFFSDKSHTESDHGFEARSCINALGYPVCSMKTNPIRARLSFQCQPLAPVFESVLFRKISRLSKPRPMMWIKASGASILALRCIFSQYHNLSSKQSIYVRPLIAVPDRFLSFNALIDP